ncbi:MAG: hypothetical protein ACK551_05495 [Vampirovibrionales bacterium]
MKLPTLQANSLSVRIFSNRFEDKLLELLQSTNAPLLLKPLSNWAERRQLDNAQSLQSKIREGLYV